MSRIILLSLLLIFGTQTLKPQEMNRTITDPKRNKEVLIDYVTREAFLLPLFGEYYQQDYEIYRPDAQTIEKLRPLLDELEITIVLASWCGDSREQLPRFMKILDLAGYNSSRLTMIAVDSYKTGREVDVTGLEIERVPTFIFSRNKHEIGRIVETPRETLETDLLHILTGQDQ
ncbi:MAG: thioredoxin family protein [Bacteroidetes bacterium]|nr:thioredoxin family protein [Bacteroidota bacterium]